MYFWVMDRKRWTPKEVVTEADWLFKEKRKWQVALRRYILEKKPAYFYAPYFGLDVNSIRNWIEIQFTDDLNWENFGKAWQFDHIVPVTYFDFADREDLMLCWNFINIRVEKLGPNKSRGNRIDILAAKPYFQDLYEKTGYATCQKMLLKLESVSIYDAANQSAIENYLTGNQKFLETLTTFTDEEFAKLNEGQSVEDILMEREILRKFGN